MSFVLALDIPTYSNSRFFELLSSSKSVRMIAEDSSPLNEWIEQ